MIKSLLIGTGGIIGLMLIWIAVQSIWGMMFSEYVDDEDVLAGRTSCSNCGCTRTCQKNGNTIIN